MRCDLVWAAVLLLGIMLPEVWSSARMVAAHARSAAAAPQDAGTSASRDTTAGDILRARIDDEAITPVTVRYLNRVFEEAEDRGAAAVLIELDTPGGLVQSTREIVTSFLGSSVPVIVYVAPAGARAASAGVFITVAAHVAAMAPGTHIGAAHPVQMGFGQADTTGSGVMEEKILNDTRAWARSMARLRGRNADWVEAAVTESESVTAEEALDLNVIDLVADDVPGVLDLIDGMEIEIGARSVVLHTSGAAIVPIDAWWGERLLGAIANPNIAFILLILGFYGLLFEFYSPGWGVAGTLGALFLLLGFTGMSVLPISMIGLLLILVGLALFVAEAFVPSFGILTLGGVGCLIMGGVMLVDSPTGVVDLSLEVLVPVAVATGAIAFFLMGQVVRTHRQPARTGAEGMIGSGVVVVEDFSARVGGDPDAEGRTGEPAGFEGHVRTHGELWRARSDEELRSGDRARIASREGLLLYVIRDA
jgi:membrane-bound serine protease (ClpP class)